MLSKVLIWGASGHARIVADIIRLVGQYEIFGFLDSVNPERQGEGFCGAPILGGQEQLDPLNTKGIKHIIMGFGNCQARLALSNFVYERGFSLVTAVHPTAVVANDVQVSPGTVVAAGAIINPATQIGQNAIINTGASVDHECVIEEGVHICPGVHLAGKVTVGRATWVGIGATVTDHIRIGAGSIIGAGAVVVNDIPDGVIAYGVPAKVIRRVETSGK